MTTLRLSLLSLLLLPAAPAAAAAPANNEGQVICKKVELPASRFQRRMCGTRAQWEQMAEQHKALYGQIQNRPAIMIGR